MRELKSVELTMQEIYESLKMPTPHKNKKKYYRKKKTWSSKILFVYLHIKK